MEEVAFKKIEYEACCCQASDAGAAHGHIVNIMIIKHTQFWACA